MQLSQEIGVSYPTAWLMQHKIRKAMEDRDQGYRLRDGNRPCCKDCSRAATATNTITYKHLITQPEAT